MEWDVTNSFQRIFHQPQWEYHGNSMGYGAGDCPEMIRVFPMYGMFLVWKITMKNAGLMGFNQTT